MSEKLEAAKAANPKRRLYSVDTPAGEMIVGNPKREDYLLYRMQLQSEAASDRAEAADMLLKACMVDPPASMHSEILSEYPALAVSPELGAALLKAVGVTKDIVVKK